MEPAICIEMLYPDLDPGARIERVTEFGFENVEFWGWRDKDISTLKSVCERTGAKVVNFSGHRRGDLVANSSHALFLSDLEDAVAVALELQCPTLMLLTNELGPGGKVENGYEHLTFEEKHANVLQGLERALALTPTELDLVLEPLNTVIDHPGYFLDTITEAVALIEEVNSPRLKLLCDLYHLAIMGYDPRTIVRDHGDHIGYVHIADYPGRNEPGHGEGDWPGVLQALYTKGYEGYVGFEYSPYQDSDTSLESIRKLWSSFEG